MVQIIRSKMDEKGLRVFLGNPFSGMVKFVADLEREILALGGEFHADGEAALLEDGSDQANLWGGNYYPDERRIEYTSLINIRPSLGNLSLELQDGGRRKKMESIVREFLP